jgi:class 3 adenylate cyclase/tetratricopeptide (TPR) repeat protein
MAGEARKTVTVVFIDVTGSTGLGEHLDPEAFRDVMARYFATAQHVLERHGGLVEKFIGDAVMAVFGLPTVHEDDALRAVRAAADLRDELDRLNDELERERGVRIALRTGVNTGEVVVGDPGAQQFYATGDAVNIAARLEQSARPGEILIGEATRRLVREAVALEPVDELELKGKTESVPAWRLTTVERDAASFARRLEAPLVGREEELVRLLAVYEEARDERAPRLCTILGTPGVGKSRLAAELAGRVADDATVLTGRCLSYGEGITYWPLVEIMRQAEARFDLSEVVSEQPLALVAGLVGQGGAPSSTEEAFWATRKLLEGLARERPLVVVIDDVHWAEPTFLDLIEHVLDFAQDVPLLLVALARPEFLEQRPVWMSQREDRALVHLEPLVAEEVHALIDALAVTPDLPEETRRRIESASAGNPLFLEQMLAILSENGDGNGDVPVPPTIQALLAARIDELTPDEREVVEPAAVVGQEFWRAALVELCPPGLGVSASLQRLVRKELIGRVRSSFVHEDAFRFHHILIRDAAYSGIPKVRRAELHQRFADWLERTTPEFDEIVGYHLEQAFRYREELGPVGQSEQALALRAAEKLEAAGRRARGHGGMAGAATLLRRARSLMPAGRPGRVELALELARALEYIGEIRPAEELLGKAIEEAETTGDKRIQLLARVDHASLRFAHNPQASAGDARRVASEAIPDFERLQDYEGLARAWRLLSYEAWAACRWGALTDAITRALDYARKAGDRSEQAEDLTWLGLALFSGPEPASKGIARLKRVLEDAGADRVTRAQTKTFMGGLHSMLGRFDEGRELFGEGQAMLAEMGLLTRLGGRSIIAGDMEIWAGDLTAAEEHLLTGLRLLERIGEVGVRTTVAARLAYVLYQREKYDEAERFTVTSEELAMPGDIASEVVWRFVRALVLARRGEQDDAEQLMQEATLRIEKTDFLNLRADVFLARAEFAQLAGSPREAPPLIEEAIAVYEQKENVAAAERARALLSELSA